MEAALGAFGGSLTEALGSLIEFLLPAAAPADAAPRVRIASPYVRAAADEVLAATSHADLIERLDAMVVDPDLWLAAAASAPNQRESATWPEIRRKLVAAKLDMPSLRRVLGDGMAARCEQGFRAFKEAVALAERTLLELKERHPEAVGGASKPSTATTASQYARVGGLVEVLYDPKLPLVARVELMHLFRMMGAVFVIGRAEELPGKLDPWAAHALAELYALPSERAVAILSKPIQDWLPKTGASLVASAEMGVALRAMYEQWHRDAAQSGGGVYFPFGSDDRDGDEPVR